MCVSVYVSVYMAVCMYVWSLPKFLFLVWLNLLPKTAYTKWNKKYCNQWLCIHSGSFLQNFYFILIGNLWKSPFQTTPPKTACSCPFLHSASLFIFHYHHSIFGTSLVYWESLPTECEVRGEAWSQEEPSGDTQLLHLSCPILRYLAKPRAVHLDIMGERKVVLATHGPSDLELWR